MAIFEGFACSHGEDIELNIFLIGYSDDDPIFEDVTIEFMKWNLDQFRTLHIHEEEEVIDVAGNYVIYEFIQKVKCMLKEENANTEYLKENDEEFALHYELYEFLKNYGVKHLEEFTKGWSSHKFFSDDCFYYYELEVDGVAVRV